MGLSEGVVESPGEPEMMLRASTLLAGVGGGAQPRASMGAKAVQILGPGRMTWARKALILRNAPYTIESPTLGQIETRVEFGEAAKAARGKRGLDPETGLPGAASVTAKAMRGFHAPHRLDEANYPSKARGSFHTLAELQAALRAAK